MLLISNKGVGMIEKNKLKKVGLTTLEGIVGAETLLSPVTNFVASPNYNLLKRLAYASYGSFKDIASILYTYHKHPGLSFIFRSDFIKSLKLYNNYYYNTNYDLLKTSLISAGMLVLGGLLTYAINHYRKNHSNKHSKVVKKKV